MESWNIFIGRFHPLVVHLPIGFLLMATILQCLIVFLPKYFRQLKLSVTIGLVLGLIGAVLSAIVGLLLAKGGGYEAQSLQWHQWLGYVLVLFTVALLAIRLYLDLSEKLILGMLLVLSIILSVTGHLGGNLTHGETYLTDYAPAPVKTVLGVREDSLASEIPSNLDSIYVYEHLIKPILREKCVSCHNTQKAKGKLSLSTPETMEKGGESGKPFAARSLEHSVGFLRVAMNPDNPKYMPPKGEGLSYAEVRLIRWWILAGADYESRLVDYQLDEEVSWLLASNYSIDTKPKPFYELVKVDQPSAKDIDKLNALDFKVRPIAQGSPLLQVRLFTKDIREQHINALESVSEQLVWLDLSDCGVRDGHLSKISTFRNLNRLQLRNNPVTKEGITKLDKLEHLEYLGLYGIAW